jgi:hypothetical protein
MWRCAVQVVDTLRTSPHFDLRTMLGGTQPALQGILNTANYTMNVQLEAVPMLPLVPADRSKIVSTITAGGSRGILYA